MDIFQIDNSDDPGEWPTEVGEYKLFAVFYYYHYEDYGGDGEALVLTNKGWSRVNLGHCSCDGPLGNINSYICDEVPPEPSLDKLKAKNAPELNEDLEKLFKMAQKEGYDTLQQEVKIDVDSPIKIEIVEKSTRQLWLGDEDE